MSARAMHRPLLAFAAAASLAGCDFSPGLETATKLQASGMPAQVSAGQPLGLVLTVLNDKGETITRYDGKITVSVDSAYTIFGGTTTVAAKKGVATFADLTLLRPGATQRFVATAEQKGGSNIAPLTVGPVDVNGVATKLGLLAQPGTSAVAAPLIPSPSVQAQDDYGGPVAQTAANVTVALGANPTGAILGGTLSVPLQSGTATFGDLTLDRAGTGYTLVFSAPGLQPVTSAPFDIRVGRLVYTDPASGIVQLVRNAAQSTDSTVVLELKAMQALPAAYAAGLELPYDAATLKPNASLMTVGPALNPGTSPQAAAASMPATGPFAGMLVAGVSQKASGAGAVAADAAVPAGTVFFTLRVDLKPGAPFKTAFDGAALARSFRAAVRDARGDDVVVGADFGIGKLEVK